MRGRTFRSRWVVRWGLLAGSVCLVAAVFVGVSAMQATANRNSKAEADAERNAKLCQQQLTQGGAPLDDGSDPCSFATASSEAARNWVAAGVLALLAGVQFVGSARIGITLSGPGVIIRNPLRTHRVRWTEIDCFTTDVGYAGRLSYAFGRVELRNGESHRIEAICAMPWEPKEQFQDQRVIDALNEELLARLAELEEPT